MEAELRMKYHDATSQAMKTCQKLEEARNGFLPIDYREDIALMTSKF